MKICTQCQVSKSVDSFYHRADGRVVPQCKECSKKKARDWQKSNPSATKQSRVIAYEKARLRNRDYVFEYLQSHPCVDCGETDFRVLEFDHAGDDKFAGVGFLSQRSYSLETIKTEIAKCEVRCCNCHRRMTLARAGCEWGSRYVDTLSNHAL